MKEVYQRNKQELFEMYGDANGHTEEKAAEFLQKYGENVLEEKCIFRPVNSICTVI